MADLSQNHKKNVEYAVPEDIVTSYNHIYNNVFHSSNKTATNIFYGCVCEGNCKNIDNCICLAQHGCNYGAHNRLSFIDDIINDALHTRPIFECNSCCLCSQDCPNRVVQKGLQLKLQVYPTADKGYGVCTLQDIPKGTYVIDYAGEVLSFDETVKRISQKTTKENNYLLSVKEKYGTKYVRTDIDAAKFGNVSRFINHSCDPNLLLHPVRIETVVPRLALFAKCDIAVGLELTFDYSGGMPNEIIDASRRVSCLCSSRNCKGLLPVHHAFDSD